MIELLVVIAIIALLASLLLSAVSKAKAQAAKVLCLSNMRQWTLAFLMYTTTHDYLPREGAEFGGRVNPNTWSQLWKEPTRDVWYNNLAQQMGWVTASNYAYRADYKGFYQDKLFHCPKANFKSNVELDPRVFFSLGGNSKLINPNYSTITANAIRRVSHTVVFLELRVNRSEPKVHPEQGILMDNSVGQPSGFASLFVPRHGGYGNLGFADGHVSSRLGRHVVNTAADYPGKAILPQLDIVWTADPVDNPNLSRD